MKSGIRLDLQTRFGNGQKLEYAQVEEVDAAITNLSEWMERNENETEDNARQARAWMAKLQLFLENESALDSLMYDLEDNLVALANPLTVSAPPVSAPPVSAPPVAAPAAIIPTAAMTRPSHLSAFRVPSMLSRPRQSTPPIVSSNLSKARPMGLVRRPRSALTELPPNTPDT